MRWLGPVLASLIVSCTGAAQGAEGYYRDPALAGDTVVFAAEGDLWQWEIGSAEPARRLTTHLESERHPAVSPDGETLAFTARYEGAAEIYTMPLSGGTPTRLTYENEYARVEGWTPRGNILYSTRKFSTLPNTQLAVLDPDTQESDLVPLAQAAQGCFTPQEDWLYFTRFVFQGSHTKNYKGGTAQNLWRFRLGETEAQPLTSDYPGTSRSPMWCLGRVYFASDRDGTMNLWSMLPDGTELAQHTFHDGWDVRTPKADGSRIVYQLGADLFLYDVASGETERLPISLASDFDQRRERWIDNPFDYLSSVHLSPSGDRVVLTAYGQVFVAPSRQGRLIDVTTGHEGRCREAMFTPDGSELLTLSDASGEVEWWRFHADGMDGPEQLTEDGEVLRFQGTFSPDGRYVAYNDHDQNLWLLDLKKDKTRLIDHSPHWGFEGPAWSPDSKWLAFAREVETSFHRIFLYEVATEEIRPVTSERYDSWSASWSPDGQWIYFLSDRHFRSVVGAPWGKRQPEPFFDRETELYMISLTAGVRSPFDPRDELHPDREPDNGSEEDDSPPEVHIEWDGLAERLIKIPVPAGNYRDLAANAGRLFWVRYQRGTWRTGTLLSMEIGDLDTLKTTLSSDVRSYELSGDGQRILVREGDRLFVTGANSGSAPDRDSDAVDLGHWTFTLRPPEVWRQMFIESWRLERDYFYDPDMHGLDWPAILEKYLPLVDRITCRAELSDLQAQMASELSALHTWIWGGDHRGADDPPGVASLGAVLDRDEEAGGYRIAHIYLTDPDLPGERSPLLRPGVEVAEGDIIVTINGQSTLAAPHIGVLLRNQEGRQVRLQVLSPGQSEVRDVMVEPMSSGDEWDLRYDEWEYTRRLTTERMSEGRIGYVHLRSMGGSNIAEWHREFYPVFHRQGLILDLRHNTGGNIDSWILERLMRSAWMYWQPRVGTPYWNMQYAFRGHVVALVDERTQSDGEALAEGFRRLGLGKVIGTRTWGGEIWLTSSNRLVDHGIVAAPEFGVYGPEGTWLIEGHGVDPDIVVDNLPHTTFTGKDAQLERAIEHLEKLIAEEPREVPAAPPYPRLAR